MNGADVFQVDCFLDDRDGRLQTVGLANVVTGRERMRRVDANAERELRAGLHDRAQMFEAMADAFALAGSVLKQNLQLTKTQTFARDLKAEGANFQRVFLGTATRAAR